MKSRPIFGLLLIGVFVLSACNQPTAATVDANAIYTAAAQTMQAQNPAITETPNAADQPAPMGTLSGHVANPLTDGVYSILVVAYDTSTLPIIGDWYYQKLDSGQENYSIGAPGGNYYIVAYILNENSRLAGPVGGYTNAVTCGLTANCTDHNLMSVPVASGKVTPNINPNDFNGPMDQYPPMPGSGEQPGEAGPPPATAPNALQSLPDCSTIRDNVARAIPYRWTMIDEPYTDSLSGATGMVCHIEADGNGVDFGSLGVGGVANAIQSSLNEWTPDLSRQAAGPNAIQMGYARGSATLVVNVSMEASPDANCPSDQPISACVLTPEQELYTIILRGWQ